MRASFWRAGAAILILSGSSLCAQAVPKSSVISQKETLRGLKALSIDPASVNADTVTVILKKHGITLLPAGTYPMLSVTFNSASASSFIRGLAINNTGYFVELSVTQAFRNSQKYIEGVTYQTSYVGVTPKESDGRVSGTAEVLESFVKDYEAVNGRQTGTQRMPAGLADEGPYAGFWEGSNFCAGGKSQSLSWSIEETIKGELTVKTASDRVGLHVGRYNTASTPWNDLLSGSASDGQSAPGEAWLVSHFSEPDYTVVIKISPSGDEITGEYRNHYLNCTTLRLKRKTSTGKQ